MWGSAALVAHVARDLLSERPLGAELVAAVAVDFIAGRARAPWYDRAPRVAVRAAIVSALAGLALVAATVGVLVALGRARPSFSGDAISLVLSVVGALAVAARVELLARHLPDVLFGPHLSRTARAALTVLAGVAPLMLVFPVRPFALLLAATTGALSTALLQTRGPLASVGLRFGLVFASSTLFGGAGFVAGGLSPLDAASGAPAVVLASLSLLGAVFVTLRGPALAADREPTKPDAAG